MSGTSRDITIYDLARAAGLSPATVSRALKNHPAIRTSTRQRVQQLATEMSYRSNHFASSLRRQRTNTIGVMVHELNSHFITSVISGIEHLTTAAGYDLVIAHSSENYQQEAANAANLFHKRVDGLIASLAYDTTGLAHFDPFLQKQLPVVYFDRVETACKGTQVVIDNIQAGYAITDHLLQQGCHRIVHITGSLQRNVYRDRLEGYRQALAAHQVSFDNGLLLENDLSEEACIGAALQVSCMQPLPDAVFVTNDFCAAICMQWFKEKGLQVPLDIAVAGFNNDVIARLVTPGLTTIRYPGFEMGETAARVLLHQLENGLPSSTETIVIPSELIIRGSSLKKGSSNGLG